MISSWPARSRDFAEMLFASATSLRTATAQVLFADAGFSQTIWLASRSSLAASSPFGAGVRRPKRANTERW